MNWNLNLNNSENNDDNIQAHAIVLMARCPLLYYLAFDNNENEAKTTMRQTIIQHLFARRLALKTLLHFIYTDLLLNLNELLIISLFEVIDFLL